MEPLVSIIINNYNYARFLPPAIESALAQDLAGVEVIVVDDGSTDDSREVIERFGSDVTAVLKDNGGQASYIQRRLCHQPWQDRDVPRLRRLPLPRRSLQGG
jgi:glycosyltransferase involved in cell wall biosynthesis